MKRISLGMLIVILSVFSLAFQWPWEVQQQEAAKKKQQTNSQANIGASVKRNAPRQQSAGSAKSEIENKQQSAGGDAGTDATQIQKRLDDVVRVNNALKAKSSAQAKEIAQLGGQIQVHQQLLKSLAPPPASIPNYPRTDAQEVLRQQKIRLTQTQTQQTKELLDNLKRSESIRR